MAKRQNLLILNIQIISAGAGSGKTYRLTNDLVTELRNGVRAKGIIATTFTKKAAAELQERVRVKLLEEGMKTAADDLSAAMIGTVHSVGTRLLERFAFEAGVSPLLEIIADEDQKLFFHQSLSQVLNEQRIVRMNELADLLGLTKKNFGGEYDWRSDIQKITELARSNAFTAADLQESKAKSWADFEALLPKQEGPQPSDAQGWNNRLKRFLDEAIEALKNNENDSTKTTQTALDYYKTMRRELGFLRGHLFWHQWAKIGKTKPGAKSRELVVNLQAFARQVEAHPDFISQTREYMDMVFDIATDALEEYAAYKRRRGLIDYGDMETEVAKLLDRPEVQAALKSEIDLLLVDEFQDTSPIQLDIFLKLSKIAKKAIWVGDPKQSIYGFRGAEPALMEAVLEKTGGVQPDNVLECSWRSRADLVNASNAIFTKAFHKTDESLVALKPTRTKDKEPAEAKTALMHWQFRNAENEKKVPKSPWVYNCIADQIKVLLERGLSVQPKGETTWRPIQAGDISVLCRSNKNCLDMADALHKTGLQASMARTGLLGTLEARLVLACLRLLINPGDALSVAELKVLAQEKPLTDVIASRLHFLHHKKEEESDYDWESDNKLIEKIRILGFRTADLSASEILDLLLDELDIRRLVLRLGSAEQRLGNLDMLRSFSRQYEDACQRTHSAASLGGFLIWLNRIASAERDKQSHTENADAVQVLTYHKSKGLEYPLVICADMENRLRADVWGQSLVNEAESVDLDNVLAQRRIRFWVNPFADQVKGTRLHEAIETHTVSLEAKTRALQEEARLLYVGLTRARDYLVFPTTVKPTSWLNRVFNAGDENMPTLEVDSAETPFFYPKNSHDALEIHCETIFKESNFGAVERPHEVTAFHPPKPSEKKEHEHQEVDISTANPNGKINLGTPESFAAPILGQGLRQSDLEQGVRACFCSNWELFTSKQQKGIAERQAVFFPDLMPFVPVLEQTTHYFYQYILEKYAPKHIFRNVPVHQEREGQCIEGTIDFVLDTAQGTVLLQLGGTTQGMKTWKNEVQNKANELLWLQEGLFSNTKIQMAVVLGMDGVIVDV